METKDTRRLSRRSFLRHSVRTVAGLTAAMLPACVSTHPETTPIAAEAIADYLPEKTIAELQTAMQSGQLSAHTLVLGYISRIKAIDQAGPRLRSFLEINPDALKIADSLDAERAASGPRGPLHGIPILLKDNIDTSDRMLTTAGSLALIGSHPARDASVAKKLRDAGVVILGKANLSEWANFRSTTPISGWSARGGQTRNPYVLDHSPCGSSSGSAVAVSANLTATALGTETDGSIVCPAAANGVVGIKPTVGLTSRSGVIPIAHSQDAVGPIARTVTDAALVLGALTGVDPRDPPTEASAGKFFTDYSPFLDPDGLRGVRIGVPRDVYFGYHPETDKVIDAAIETMRAAGATIVDPADIPTAQAMDSGTGEFTVMLYEFKAGINQYLASRIPNPKHPDFPQPRTLADLIKFNEETAAEEMPYFGQEIFYLAQSKGPLTEAAYLEALASNHRLSRQEGIDAVMEQHRLEALVAPTGPPAWSIIPGSGDLYLGSSSQPAAMAGYPLITVPAGYLSGLPVGITFIGQAYSEPVLIKLAYAFEQATKVRRPPQFRPILGSP